MAKVAIVSAFDRGQYLAEKLAGEGLDVMWIDLSHLFRWPATSWSGPFPLMQAMGISDDVWAWVARNFSLRESKPGFTIFTSYGPLEFRSSLVAHRLGQLNLASEILQTPSAGVDKEFLKTWPLRALALGTRAEEFAPATPIDRGFAKSFRESLLQKVFQVRGREQTFSDSKNLQILRGYQVEDVAFQPRDRVSGILLKKERSELVNVDQLIWALSSSETRHLSVQLNQKLFGGVERESVYSWITYDVKIVGSDYLPSFFMWIEDPELPWSHENFISFQRTDGDNFQVWLKIATHQRFSSSSHESEEKNWRAAFEQRFPGLKVQVLRSPLEQSLNTKDLGAPLFATFQEGTLQRNLELRQDTVHYLSPEFVKSLLFHELLREEERVAHRVGAWWKQQQEIIAKKKLRESRT